MSRRHLLATDAAYRAYAGAYGTLAADRSWIDEPLAELATVVRPGGLVLDLGCGPGNETVELREHGYRVVGLDLSLEFLRLARQRHPGPGYVGGHFLALPFERATFDGVWASSSLVHLRRAEMPESLAEVRRVLKPGGGMYCSLQLGTSERFATPRDWDPIRLPRFYAFWSAEEFASLAADADFEVVSLRVADSPEIEPTCNEGGRGWINAALRSP